MSQTITQGLNIQDLDHFEHVKLESMGNPQALRDFARAFFKTVSRSEFKKNYNTLFETDNSTRSKGKANEILSYIAAVDQETFQGLRSNIESLLSEEGATVLKKIAELRSVHTKGFAPYFPDDELEVAGGAGGVGFINILLKNSSKRLQDHYQGFREVVYAAFDKQKDNQIVTAVNFQMLGGKNLEQFGVVGSWIIYSTVHPDYRGQKVFKGLLDWVRTTAADFGQATLKAQGRGDVNAIPIIFTEQNDPSKMTGLEYALDQIGMGAIPEGDTSSYGTNPDVRLGKWQNQQSYRLEFTYKQPALSKDQEVVEMLTYNIILPTDENQIKELINRGALKVNEDGSYSLNSEILINQLETSLELSVLKKQGAAAKDETIREMIEFLRRPENQWIKLCKDDIPAQNQHNLAIYSLLQEGKISPVDMINMSLGEVSADPRYKEMIEKRVQEFSRLSENDRKQRLDAIQEKINKDGKQLEALSQSPDYALISKMGLDASSFDPNKGYAVIGPVKEQLDHMRSIMADLGISDFSKVPDAKDPIEFVQNCLQLAAGRDVRINQEVFGNRYQVTNLLGDTRVPELPKRMGIRTSALLQAGLKGDFRAVAEILRSDVKDFTPCNAYVSTGGKDTPLQKACSIAAVLAERIQESGGLVVTNEAATRHSATHRDLLRPQA